jgi:hypothetical protein
MKYYADNSTRDARIYTDRGQLAALVDKIECVDRLHDALRLAGLLHDGESLMMYVTVQPPLPLRDGP